MDRWPVHLGRAFHFALKVCLAITDSAQDPEIARQAFLDAADEADIFIRLRRMCYVCSTSAEGHMNTVDEIWGNPEEIAEELHRSMHYANDLIKRAARAGLSVDLMTLTMHGADGKIPQISFAMTKTLQREKDEVRARR